MTKPSDDENKAGGNNELQSGAGAVVDWIWNLFRSTKFALFLLIFISAAAIIGTLIPQNPPQEQLMTYSEGWRRFLESFNLFDLYHSKWFQGSLALLCINLFICSIDRIPAAWKQIKSERPTPASGDPERMKLGSGIDVAGDVESVASKVRAFLKSAGGRVVEDVAGDNRFFLLNRGRYSRLGVYILHLSIILIVLGALAGNLFGYHGRLVLPEGEPQNSFFRQVGKSGGEMPLGFTALCKSFTFNLDPKTGMAGDYTSKLEIQEGGKVVAEPTVMVNHPFHYKGISLFQSSYQLRGVQSVTIGVKDKEGKDLGKAEIFANNKSVEIPGGGKMKLLDVAPDMQSQTIVGALFEYDGGDAGKMNIEIVQGRPNSFNVGASHMHRLFQSFPNFDKMNAGGDRYFQIGDVTDSKVEIVVRSMADDSEIERVAIAPGESAVTPGGTKIKITEYDPEFEVHGKKDKMALIEVTQASEGSNLESLVGGMQYTFEGFDGQYATVLDVNHDPGVWLVWTGCTLMFVGLWMAFFMSHRKIWVKVAPGRISVGGLANRNVQSFENEFNKLAERLKNKLNG